MRKLLILFTCLFFSKYYAQELNCTVEFNTSQVSGTNQQIFKTLKKSLTEFINNTKWTDKTYKSNEKINCSFLFNISSFDNLNQFTGSLQVTATRPVYDATYTTSILNINDKELNFTYNEFQNLVFNPNSYESNLISVVAFYANMIIGMDADTFALEGGTKAFENASNIVAQAQVTQEKGWVATSPHNRYFLVNDMLSPTFASYRKTIYDYHLGALDKMAENSKLGKEAIQKAIFNLKEIAVSRPNAYLTRIFFDTKSDEILSVFSEGPKMDVVQLVETLSKLSPTNISKWSQISF
ncbi:DUF4835 family protein [Flavobacterium oreochromis]|uniref:DUF4835 family protein n=1 Tax=Flavobacterium oreochromis TaxID=2906078 RepID=A0ABW8P7Y5_9FLAO|nr:DUF4835 family protein [Flavobacterium oreochromis]OWP78050.1 DUF4835 domain-containing protein [Flavobacterium oreochromis]QYS85876.1 DUF4835 family protein [Flavobacterium oreochromis]